MCDLSSDLNVSMWKIEHLSDVKFRAFLCDSYQHHVSLWFLSIMPLGKSHSFYSSDLCTDARCYLSFSLSLPCLAIFPFHINIPDKDFKLIIVWNTFVGSTSLFHLKGCSQYSVQQPSITENLFMFLPGNTKGGSITVPLTSCLTGLD